MKFKISQMSAYALLDHASLDLDLAEQIKSASSKAEKLYLFSSIESLQKARDELKAYMESNTDYNEEAYKLILKEVEFLASEDT